MMAKNSWIKLHTDILNKAKIGMLPADLWRLNIELRLLADDQGFLPSEEYIAFYLHRDSIDLGEKIKELARVGLVEWIRDSYLWFIPDFVISQGPTFVSLYPENWEDLRQEVLLRDRGQCLYCGNAATHVDHIIPVTKGGSHAPSNLASACEHCNKSKNNRDFMEWYLKQSCFDSVKADHIKTILCS